MIERKYIHFSKDVKFINSAIQQFENIAEGESVFYALMDSEEDEIKNINTNESVIKITKIELSELINRIDISSIVFFHSLFPDVYPFILALDRKIKIVWFCFGFEVYNDNYFFDDKFSLGSITYSLYARKSISKREYFSTFIRSKLRFLFRNLSMSTYEQKKQVFKRINLIGSPFREEFEKIKKIINFGGNYFEFSYYPIELIISQNDINKNNKCKILVGNSGFYTSNHLEVFETLRNNDLSKYQVVVPLNYGKKAYIDFLTKKGFEYFGADKFNPLLESMSIDDYNELLNEVEFAFLNNRRQQAVGNTIALIYLGANVILNEENPMYKFLRRIGVIVHKFNEDFDLNKLKKLTDSELDLNRMKLMNYFGKVTLEKSLSEQLNQIKSF